MNKRKFRGVCPFPTNVGGGRRRVIVDSREIICWYIYIYIAAALFLISCRRRKTQHLGPCSLSVLCSPTFRAGVLARARGCVGCCVLSPPPCLSLLLLLLLRPLSLSTSSLVVAAASCAKRSLQIFVPLLMPVLRLRRRRRRRRPAAAAAAAMTPSRSSPSP